MEIVIYELDKIHEPYGALKHSKLIACNCSICKDSQEPHFYPYELLRKFTEHRQTIQCQKSYNMVDFWGSDDDASDKRQLVKEEERKSGIGPIFEGPVNVYGNLVTGNHNMAKKSGEVTVKSAWANGLFYLLVFVVVIAGLGFLASTVSVFVLPLILIAGAIFVPIIGALQLKQDGRFSDKSFVELMRIVVGQLPLVGKLARKNQEKS
jgi:hypothetical protein